MPYFTIFQSYLFLSSDLNIEEKKKLNNFLSLLEESGIGKIIERELNNRESNAGRKVKEPYRLFAAIIYAFSIHSGSLRKIEESIKYDLRFIYLMNKYTPSYVTISKLLNSVAVKNCEIIFSSIMKTIINKFEINIDDCFIDGTKLEANSNKYKFVYKPTTFKLKLFAKIKELLTKYFDLRESKTTFTSKEVGDYIIKFEDILKSKSIDIDNIKTGKGTKNPKEVKDYILLLKYLIKLLDYEEKELICGPNRNSYYKTDKDATAMCLKEDYYSGLGSNMHAAYNLQLIVSKGLILGFYVSQDRNDYRTLIPTLNSYKNMYGTYPKRLCADSGYGSLLNYKFLKENNIENYIKFSDWNKLIDGSYKNLYHFDQDGNFICLNNKIGKEYKEYNGRHPHSSKTIYVIENCKRCKYKDYCFEKIKDKKNERMFEANKELFFFRNEAIKNLLSKKGIEMRVNRSAQSEGAFGVIKQDMDYERLRRRGLEKVNIEIMLICLGYNIRKLFSIMSGEAKMDYWKAPKNLTEETLPEIKLEKLLNKKIKGKNEKLRAEYKHKKSR